MAAEECGFVEIFYSSPGGCIFIFFFFAGPFRARPAPDDVFGCYYAGCIITPGARNKGAIYAANKVE